MSVAAQIIAVAVVGAVFVVRLAAAIHSALHDGRTEHHTGRPDVTVLSTWDDPRPPASAGTTVRQGHAR